MFGNGYDIDNACGNGYGNSNTHGNEFNVAVMVMRL